MHTINKSMYQFAARIFEMPDEGCIICLNTTLPHALNANIHWAKAWALKVCPESMVTKTVVPNYNLSCVSYISQSASNKVICQSYTVSQSYVFISKLIHARVLKEPNNTTYNYRVSNSVKNTHQTWSGFQR